MCYHFVVSELPGFLSFSLFFPFSLPHSTTHIERPIGRGLNDLLDTKNVIIVIIVIISSFGFDLHLLESSKELKNFRPGYSVDPHRTAPWLSAVAHISVSRQPNGHTYSSHNFLMIFEAHLDSFSANSANPASLPSDIRRHLDLIILRALFAEKSESIYS